MLESGGQPQTGLTPVRAANIANLYGGVQSGFWLLPSRKRVAGSPMAKGNWKVQI